MPESIRLSNAALAQLPHTVDRPRYDRSALSPGIVHIGVGNFHRAHQAWYLHRLMQTGNAHDWAIVGAGVRPYDAVMREKLLAQDCLTTLIELDPETTRAKVIGPMIDYLPIEENNQALIRQMSDPCIRIVSLTVTEGGYYLDPATKCFDAVHPDIRHDVENPSTPRTAFGAMVEALRLRRAAGHKPFTGLSCDNIQGNGDTLRQALVSLARLSNPDLADWIEAEASFPNAMVDSIAPALDSDGAKLTEKFLIHDSAPVVHEPYRQWVIEDRFCAGRPPWEDVGVIFSDDVHAYETMKIRLLNGGHQLLANAGEILGLETICDCMHHPQIRAFFQKVTLGEIAPLIPPVPSITAHAYVDLIAKRFSNPLIRDTTRRVAFDGSSRHPGFLLPSVHEGLIKGTSVEGLALAEALWARMCAGTREDGRHITPNDPNWEHLNVVALKAKSDPMSWLEENPTYSSLMNMKSFTNRFVSSLAHVWNHGTLSAISAYLRAG